MKAYRTVIRKHLDPLFGDLRVRHLNPVIVDDRLSQRLGKSMSTRRRILTVLRMVIQHCIHQGTLSDDPTKDIKLRQTESKPKEMICLDREEMGRLLTAADDVRFGNFFRLLILTGIRSGEAMALRACDFSEDFTRVHIRRTVSDSEDGLVIKDRPKTAAGNRKLPLPEIVRQGILDELQMKKRRGIPGETIFSTRNGTVPGRDYLHRFPWEKLKRKALLPSRTRIHDLRHTYATVSLDAGLPVHLVSRMLGHASVTMTLNIYSHALPSAAREAADVVGGIADAALSAANSEDAAFQ